MGGRWAEYKRIRGNFELWYVERMEKSYVVQLYIKNVS